MAKQEEEFFWLELKPQQKFKDDEENNMLKIIQHASEFAFFVFRNKAEMKMIVRTRKNDQNLFKTIAGVSAEPVEKPHFERMVSKYLTLKNKHSMIPLVDLKSITKSNLYSKLWAEQRGYMMACFVCDQTKKISSEIDRKINSLERRAATKGVTLSGKNKAELAAAKQKREGHSHYNCTLAFGVQTGAPELSEIQAEKRRKMIEERNTYELRIKNLESLDTESRKEYDILRESYKKAVKKIEDDFRSDLKTVREDIKETTQTLDKIINNVLLNSFAHRIATHKVRLSFGKKNFRQRLAEIFGMTNPYTFVPKKLHSKSMVLTEVELAFFISLPEEYDVQTINFGIGPTPTFVHGQTEEMSDTDLTTDF
jgi:hypothetical protein